MKSYIRAVLGREKAFTLMELLIVIAIIAILTVAFLPNALRAPAKARDAVRIKKVQDIQTAVEAFTAERGSPPTSATGGDLNCLIQSVADDMGIPLPLDQSKLISCGVATHNDKYFYKYDSANRFYIIGAIMEVPTSANSSADAFGDLAGVATITAARDLGTTTIQTVGPRYFIAVGPI